MKGFKQNEETKKVVIGPFSEVDDSSTAPVVHDLVRDAALLAAFPDFSDVAGDYSEYTNEFGSVPD
ncbi:hypothetical protein CFE70_000476 [Pyrenophora teres f. teres 0-1]|uniref:Uncharacterized protein n=1 Tax=Pyrenophora teres f. teres (strain 0-1) TaxID=861557 RepID=E3RX94_PYRTT|nr:hypothetical protein PTT_13998 [Pyrenophora teres f. teres 0-1]KAK1917875.1 hypothetical protein P3342_000592 [Pyrenophora teres f. teres]